MLERNVRIAERPYDVYLVSQTGERVGAHWDVLAECSFYFECAIKTLEEDTKHDVPINHFVPISTDCLKSIVRFSYTENIEDTEENVLELLAVSDFLQISRLDEQCKKLIVACLNSHNWVEVWRFARKRFADLAEAVMLFVSDNISDLVRDRDVQDLNFEELVELLVDVPKITEDARAEAIFAWLKRDPEQRVCHAASQMASIPTIIATHLQDAIRKLCSHNVTTTDKVDLVYNL